MRRSLVAFLVISLICSCKNSSQNATTVNETTKLQQINQSTTSSEDKSATETSIESIGNSLIRTEEILKGDSAAANNDYELRIEYPQLKKSTTLSERKFNRHIKNLVNKEVRAFERYCRKERQHRKKALGFSLGLTYSSNIVSPKLLCLDLRWSSYTGYLNSDYFTTTVNYDLERGRELRLSDLFKPKSKYLELLSTVGLKVLKKTCISCDCSAGSRLPEGVENSADLAGFKPMKEALAPKIESFELWGLSKSGIVITFDEYEIAPGCAGIISITLPFAELSPVLHEDIITSKL